MKNISTQYEVVEPVGFALHQEIAAYAKASEGISPDITRQAVLKAVILDSFEVTLGQLKKAEDERYEALLQIKNEFLATLANVSIEKVRVHGTFSNMLMTLATDVEELLHPIHTTVASQSLMQKHKKLVVAGLVTVFTSALAYALDVQKSEMFQSAKQAVTRFMDAAHEQDALKAHQQEQLDQQYRSLANQINQK